MIKGVRSPEMQLILIFIYPYKEKNYGLSLIVFKLGYRIKTQKIKIYYCFLSILMYIYVLFNCFGVFIFLTLSQLNMYLFSCSIELIMAIIKY